MLQGAIRLDYPSIWTNDTVHGPTCHVLREGYQEERYCRAMRTTASADRAISSYLTVKQDQHCEPELLRTEDS